MTERALPDRHQAEREPFAWSGASDVGHCRRRLLVRSDELVWTARNALTAGFRLGLVAGHDDGDWLRVVYLFLAGQPDRRLELVVELDARHPVLPSMAEVSFTAGRFERELADLFGVQLIGHPAPRRMVKHQHWPAEWYPMRHHAPPAPALRDDGKPYPFAPVEGDGIYEIPVGPVHAGLIEPGHFRFWVVGETVLRLKARLWFTHKGIEKLFEGRDVQDGVALAERVSGDTAVGHGLAYCQAVEEATGTRVSPPTLRRRALLLEIERLHNHVNDLGALCNDVGFGVVQAYALRVREQLMRLNGRLTGHRLGRGGIVPGGAALHDSPTCAELAAVGGAVHELVDLALRNSIVQDRFTGTGVLSTADALEIGVLGYVARASEVDIDARRDHPAEAVSAAVRVPVLSGGDVLARFGLRVQEIDASLELLRELLPQTTVGTDIEPQSAWAGPGSGVGICEGWRGTIVHRVEVADGRLRRVRVVDPSFPTWPALPVVMRDTIVPDFPLTNKSFNLSYAGNDL